MRRSPTRRGHRRWRQLVEKRPGLPAETLKTPVKNPKGVKLRVLHDELRKRWQAATKVPYQDVHVDLVTPGGHVLTAEELDAPIATTAKAHGNTFHVTGSLGPVEGRSGAAGAGAAAPTRAVAGDGGAGPLFELDEEVSFVIDAEYKSSVGVGWPASQHGTFPGVVKYLHQDKRGTKYRVGIALDAMNKIRKKLQAGGAAASFNESVTNAGQYYDVHVPEAKLTLGHGAAAAFWDAHIAAKGSRKEFSVGDEVSLKPLASSGYDHQRHWAGVIEAADNEAQVYTVRYTNYKHGWLDLARGGLDYERDMAYTETGVVGTRLVAGADLGRKADVDRAKKRAAAEEADAKQDAEREAMYARHKAEYEAKAAAKAAEELPAYKAAHPDVAEPQYWGAKYHHRVDVAPFAWHSPEEYADIEREQSEKIERERERELAEWEQFQAEQARRAESSAGASAGDEAAAAERAAERERQAEEQRISLARAKCKMNHSLMIASKYPDRRCPACRGVL